MSQTSGIPHALSLVTARFLGTFATIRPDERRQVAGAFLTLFGFMAGHALLETARDALFLARWPASQLPWVYLSIAGVALLFASRQDRLLRRFQTRNEISAWLAFSGIVTFGFWLLTGLPNGWVFYGLYVWSGVLATLVVVRFWTVLGSLLTVTQAKRLFAVIGSGSVLGAIAGSAAARVLTGVGAARTVVLAAALVFLASSLIPRLLRGGESDAESHALATSSRDPWAAVRMIWNRPYVRRIALLILLATITFTLVDFVFKSTVDRFVAAPQLGAFFATVYLILNLLSLFVQVFVVTWLVRRLGINTVQAVAPTLLLVGAMGFVAIGGLAAVLVLKAADAALRHSLYRTGSELLFVPMSIDVRGRVKAFIDVVGQRGGQALASLIILTLLTITTREAIFAMFAGVAALAWLMLAMDLRTHYINLFRETLREEQTLTRIEFPDLNARSLGALLATLREQEERKVIAVLDLLDAQGKMRTVPTTIFDHPSPRVIVHALDLFLESGRTDMQPMVTRLLEHEDPRVASAALRAQAVLVPNREALSRAVSRQQHELAATATAALIARGWLDGERGDAALRAVVGGQRRDEQLALAQAIRFHPHPQFDWTLTQLAAVADPEVRLDAVRAIGASRRQTLSPVLIDLLRERALRDEVRLSLVAMGHGVLSNLLAALEDHRIPHDVRRHIPMTIAAFGTPRAAQLLLRHLLVETDGMIRFKILRALGRLRADHPEVPLDEAMLTEAFHQTLGVAFNFLRWRRALERGVKVRGERATPVHDALVALLRDKQLHAFERLFRLLNLLANDEDFARIHRGLQSVRRETRAGSRELIEHLVFRRFREPLLMLVDDLYEPGDAVFDEDDDEEDVYEPTLVELVGSNLESVSCFAAAQIAALELRTLRPHLRERAEFSEHHFEVMRNARDALGQAPQ